MHWKWIFRVSAFLVVVLVITGYVIVSRYDFNAIKPEIVRKVEDATGRELFLEGDIKFNIGFTPAVVIEDVAFQNAPWGSRAQMAKIKRLKVHIALLPLIRKTIEIRRLILIEPDILIETNRAGQSNLEFESIKKQRPGKLEKEAPIKKPTASAIFPKRLIIEKGCLTFRDGKSGHSHAMILDRFTAAASGAGGSIRLKLKGDYNGEAFQIEGTLGSMAAFTAPDRAWPVELTAKAAGFSVNVKGAVKNPLKGQGLSVAVTAESRSIPTIARLFNVTGIPEIGPFNIAAKLTDDRSVKSYKISDLKMSMQESDLVGSMEIRLAEKKPRIQARLSLRNLNLGPWVSKDGDETENQQKTSAKPAARKGRVFSNASLPVKWLNRTNADVEIRAERLLMPPVTLSDAVVNMVLEDGHLTVKPFRLAMDDGFVNGALNLRSRGETAIVEMELNSDQFDLGRVLEGLGVHHVLEGKADIDINFKGRGNSTAALMAGLNGKTTVIMKDGRINNKFVKLFGSDLSSDFFALLKASNKKTEDTPINCFVSVWDIRNGLAETTALLLDTSEVSVIGYGRINLKTEALDLSFNPTPKKGVGIKGLGKLNLSLGGLTEPFKLKGTLSKPSLAIDPTGTMVTLGKAIGGAVLFGPLGIAAAMAGGELGDKNPCLVAIDVAKKGVDDKKSKREKNVFQGATGDFER